MTQVIGEARKQRTAMLKALREERGDAVAATQSRLKAQQRLRKQLKAALKDGPLTIPELASAIELPTQEVLWHVTAMKKYDLLVEAGFDGEYFQYGLPEGDKR